MLDTLHLEVYYWFTGTSFQYVFSEDDHQLHLECLPCEGDRFEPEETISSLSSSIQGCTYQHLAAEQLSEHLVPYKIGTKSTAAEYICDYVNGFYEKDGYICNDIPIHPCYCIEKTCSLGYLLRLGKVLFFWMDYLAYLKIMNHLKRKLK